MNSGNYKESPSQKDEEMKKLFSDEPLEMGANASQFERIQQPYDEFLDDELLNEYDVVNDENINENLLTPFRGSMLGGTFLGDGDD